jgi:hypothetical protein
MTREGIFFGNAFIEEMELQGVCFQCGDLVEDENESYSIMTEEGERFFCCLECYEEYAMRYGDYSFEV